MALPTADTDQPISSWRDWLVIQLADLLDEPVQDVARLEDTDDLLGCGMDSIRLMYLCERLRREGYALSLPDLSDKPTLGAWVDLLATSSPKEQITIVTHSETTAPEAAFDLTPVQQAYWLGRSADEVLGNVSCHAFLVFRATGVDPQRLDRACHLVRERHPMLRARFTDGYQQIQDTPQASIFDHQDWRTMAPQAAQVSWDALYSRRSHECLDVEHGQVFLVGLVQMPDGEDRVWLSLDLLAADVESLRLLLSELGMAYTDPEQMPPVPRINFADYLASRVQRLHLEREVSMRWWRERLSELPTGPALPLACAPESIHSPHFQRISFQLSSTECRRLEQQATSAGVTLASVFGCVFTAILARWSEQHTFLLNVPLFDRHGDTAEIDRVIADFTNLALVSCETWTDLPFNDAVKAFQRALHEAIAHSAYPALEVLRDARRQGIACNAPVVYSCNLGRDAFVPANFQKVFGDLHDMISQTPQVWLDHQLYRIGNGILLAWDSVDGLFPDGMLKAMFDAYVACIQQLCSQNWQCPLEVALPWTQQCLRAKINATPSVSCPRLLHQDFFELAKIAPNMPALWHQNSAISRGALAELALRVAAGLKAVGVGYGDAVEISLPRSPEQIAAVFGVLAVGACYVPIDQSQPPARQKLIETAAEIKAVIGQSAMETSPPRHAFHTLAAFPPLPTLPLVFAQASAYLIYTSGSTGVPKGVEVSHTAAINTIDAVRKLLHVTPQDRLLAVSALDFDLSVFDLFGILGAGASLILLEQDETRDAARWGELAQRHQATLWNSAPALLEMMLVAPEAAVGLGHLRAVLLSGDWVSLDLPAKLRTHTSNACAIYALGGATEAGIWSNVQQVDNVPPHWRSIPYGVPLPGQAYRVVDARGRDVPDHVPGELLIGGASLARGYRNDPLLTSERFIQQGASRWYRTGDRGRYWADGTLEFLGRTDQQVKVRGLRIELGEIESVLDAHPGVLRSCATVLPDSSPRLAAVIVPVTQQTSTAASQPWVSVVFPDTLPAEGRITRAILERLLQSDKVSSPSHTTKWQQWLDVETTGAELPLAEALQILDWQEAWLDDAVTAIAEVVKPDGDSRRLLFDPHLAPQALATYLPAGRKALQHMAGAIACMAKQHTGSLRIAVLDVRAGQMLPLLLDVLDTPNVQVTLFDTSPSLLAAAQAAFTQTVPAVRRLYSGMLPADCAAHFDCVISYATLHAYDDLRDGIWLAASLLASNGHLLIADVLRDSPLRQISAALFSEQQIKQPASYADTSKMAMLFDSAGFISDQDAWHSEAFAFAHLRALKEPIPAVEELRQWLVDNLPATMHPESLWYMRTLALSANGKIDRKNISEQMAQYAENPAFQRATFSPGNSQEAILFDCWCELLGEQAGVHDATFFSLGGDSLLATRLLSRLRERLGIRVGMADFYQQPTLLGLAMRLAEAASTDCGAQQQEEGVL